jgi:hypothetical protein
MSAGHLICNGCRIRVRAHAPEIDLLEACCPICQAPLAPASASSVIGFRLFDLDPFSGHAPQQPEDGRASLVDMLDSASRRSDRDASPWL